MRDALLCWRSGLYKHRREEVTEIKCYWCFLLRMQICLKSTNGSESMERNANGTMSLRYWFGRADHP